MKFQCLLCPLLLASTLGISLHDGTSFLTPSAPILSADLVSALGQANASETPARLPIESSILHVNSDHHQHTIVASYNKETPIIIQGRELGLTVEGILAGIFICMIASVPLAIGYLEAKPSKTHIVQSAVLVVWLLSCLFLFTHVVYFQSVHFTGERPLTLVETIYLMAQVLTTVGHGDITPATANAQVIVALYVFFTILLVADLVSAVVHLAITHTQDYTKKLTQFYLDRQATVAKHVQELEKDLSSEADLLHRGKPPLPWKKFCTTWSVFLVLVSAGVLFYHLFPGENKSWLEAIYMSVITLTTVGFGSVLPATEAGKVFSAFWMLFGVVSLLSVVSGCTELILAIKAREQWSQEDERVELDGLRVRALSASSDGSPMVSRAEFIRFAILQSRAMGKDEFARIERTFQAFGPDSDGNVPFEAIERATLLRFQSA